MSRKQKKNRESSGKSTYFNVDWQNAELSPDFSEWVGTKWKARTNIASVAGVTQHFSWVAWRKVILPAVVYATWAHDKWALFPSAVACFWRHMQQTLVKLLSSMIKATGNMNENLHHSQLSDTSSHNGGGSGYGNLELEKMNPLGELNFFFGERSASNSQQQRPNNNNNNSSRIISNSLANAPWTTF
ncbi:hypothetical protein DAPPUDRAFT_99754 [Daphnia pulex]|uniref:Uncharacterized protein n=1 Tax=Daphnia pulex TaxID=6669 RepID=E9G861_DAPPU|nr:hypothetical protein DAPPUDRAFT_99754 [Daphnia pulex]|eukprot:EFX83922.1 hypothetical protein DAPPUDRAFT_99754 [Daphnia pulex]